MKTINRMQLLDLLSRTRGQEISELVVHGIYNKYGHNILDDTLEDEKEGSSQGCNTN